jgi:hypothetical protein
VTPPTIKVRPRTGVVPAQKKQQNQLPPSSPPKQSKGLIRRILEIVINDIKHPSRIFEKKKEIVMPESKETWKDWEGQI